MLKGECAVQKAFSPCFSFPRKSSGVTQVELLRLWRDERDWGWEVWSGAGLDHPGQHGAGHNRTILTGRQWGIGFVQDRGAAVLLASHSISNV